MFPPRGTHWSGGQRQVVIGLFYQQVESALRVRLDQLELRETDLERFDWVAVLDFVEAMRGPVVVPAAVGPLVVVPPVL
jgi:hypothetical protein